MVKFMREIKGLFYLVPGLGLVNGLRRVYAHKEVLEMAEIAVKSSYEWVDPRPDSPIPLKHLHGLDRDEFGDESDPNYEYDDGETSTDEESDTSDDLFRIARNRVRECNNKLLRIAKELQEQAAEGLLGAQLLSQASHVQPAPTLEEGNISEYEESGDEIHTPLESEEEGDMTVRKKKRVGEIVDPNTDFSKFKWSVGKRFPIREAFKEAVAKWDILHGRNVMISHNNKSRQQQIGIRCISGCPFYLYATWDTMRATLVVRRVARPHWPAKEIVETIRRAYKVVVTRGFAYKVKYDAHKLLHGSMTDHYRKVMPYLEALKTSSPGTSVELVTTVGKRGAPIFQRLFTCFQGLQKGFMKGCRKVICVDACFFKTFLGGQLLSAVGRDGNEQMHPIALAVVESENNESWQWFFDHIQACLQLGDGEGVVIISDEHQAKHRHCARHIFALWHKSFKGEFKLQFWKIAKAYNQADYNEALKALGVIIEYPANAFKVYNPKLFCRAFLDCSMRTDAITNNMAETFNAYIINARTKHLLFT
ncbi:uncharacterized protein LOC125492827 [Beta vulgaris subsp. vulgaris]|uniref:uncharacterized protein LOC125492827 n=1 Tax=Beta vulgaris subsp. vulgaris TaxID=3555 RepID=UPI0020367498|nr:uncharacterized protein LOC125492827 [Beta vulgaris subsp. vulgaris]